jgi:hypothetical protein
MNIAHADTRDPLEVFYERLTPQGRAKLGVPREKLAPAGHEIARVFLSPLAKNGPLSANKVQTETTTTERKDRNRFLTDRLMKHQVELLGGYEMQELGTPIDWFRAPQNDWQWPTHLSRHYYLMPLGYVYRTTGEARYADEAVAWLLDWIEKTPLESPALQNSRNNWSLRYAENKTPKTQEGVFKGYVDGPWTSLSAHARAEYWTQLLQLIHDAPALNNRNAAIILNSLTGDHRQLMLDYPRQMNQFQGVASSLIFIGLYYPDFVGSREAEQEGWKRLQQHAEREIYPDGAMAEASPNYGSGMLRRLNELVEAGHAFQRAIPPVLMSRLRAGKRYFALIADPLGRSPRIAKGGDNVLAILRELNRVSPDAQVAYVVSGGKEGQMPPLNQTFAWAGHHVFRSAWTPDATWMFFDAGPRGTGHHDVAQLGVQLISNGEMLLADPGYYSYSSEGEGGAYAKYFHSSAAHNVALVDGQNQISHATGTRPEANTQAGDYAWQNAPDRVVAQGVYSYGFGEGGTTKVLHRRKVQFLPAQSTFEIVDSFEHQNGDTQERDIALMWQLAPGSETKIGADSIAVERPKARMKMEFSGAPNPKIEQFIGRKEPLAGWFSQTYGKLEAAPTLRVSTRARLPLTITTKLIVEKK